MLKGTFKKAARGAWDESKGYLFVALVLTLIGILICFFSRCSVPSSGNNISEEVSSTEEAVVEKLPGFIVPRDWTTYVLDNAFQISVPPTVELQKEDDIYTQLVQKSPLYVDASSAIFHQKGLGNLSKGSTQRYCRIMFQHEVANYGDFFRATETAYLDAETRTALKEMVSQELIPGTSFIVEPQIDWVDFNGIKAVRINYVRHGFNGAGPVTCQMYLLFNNKEFVKILLSYRESESDIWKDDFKKVITTFKWNTIF